MPSPITTMRPPRSSRLRCRERLGGLAVLVQLKRERRAALDGASAAVRHFAIGGVDLPRLGDGAAVVQVLRVRRQAQAEGLDEIVGADDGDVLPPVLVHHQQQRAAVADEGDDRGPLLRRDGGRRRTQVEDADAGECRPAVIGAVAVARSSPARSASGHHRRRRLVLAVGAIVEEARPRLGVRDDRERQPGTARGRGTSTAGRHAAALPPSRESGRQSMLRPGPYTARGGPRVPPRASNTTRTGRTTTPWRTPWRRP